MNNKIPMWVGIGGAILMFVALAFYYQDYIGARALSLKGGRVSVKQGESLTLSITTTQAPTVKVDLCQEGVKKPRCQTLAATAKGKQVTVKVPLNFPLGKAVLKVQERDKTGKLTPIVQAQRSVTVTPADKPVEVSSGGGGGGSGGGSSGNSDVSTSIVTSAPTTPPNTHYQLSKLCYEGADDSLHLTWSPSTATIRYRIVGEPNWRTPASEYGDGYFHPHFVIYDNSGDFRQTIIYVAQNDLPPHTDFEFYFQDIGADDSSVYHYNTGDLPAYSECRSLL